MNIRLDTEIQINGAACPALIFAEYKYAGGWEAYDIGVWVGDKEIYSKLDKETKQRVCKEADDHFIASVE